MNCTKKLLYSMAVLLFPLTPNFTYAQSELQPDSVRTAKVNSPVPYFRFFEIDNQNLLLLEPSDLCNKITIIELWSSKNKTSASVISHYEYLKSVLGEKIKIVLVSEESLEDVQNFVKENHSSLSFAIDSQKRTNTIFPHTATPHTIVIDADGYVRAITYPVEVTTDILLSLFQNKPIDLKLKGELSPNQDAIFPNSMVGEAIFKSNIKGFDPDKKTNYEWFSDNEFSFTNYAVSSVYQSLYNISPVRTLIESKKAHWYRTNQNSFICFEMKMPYLKKAALKREAIAVLNKTLPLKSKIEYRTQKGYSLIKLSNNDFDLAIASKLIGENLKTDGLSVRTLKEFIQLIETYELVNAPIANNTNLSINMPVSIEGFPNTFPELKSALKKYGLGLVEKEFTTDFLILYDDAESAR